MAHTTSLGNINMSALPLEVRAKLAELDLEMAEGDITQKGYDKKRLKLLEPYVAASEVAAKVKHAHAAKDLKSPRRQLEPARKSPAESKSQPRNEIPKTHRHTRQDDRYRSDAHSEAVQAALAKRKPRRVAVLPIPVKRGSLMSHGVINSVGDSSDEDAATDLSTGDDGSLRRRNDESPSPSGENTVPSISLQRVLPQQTHVPTKLVKRGSSKSKDRSTANEIISLRAKNPYSPGDTYAHSTPLTKKLADIMPQIIPGRPLSQNFPPDVTNISRATSTVVSSVSAPAVSSMEGADQTTRTTRSTRTSVGSIDNEGEESIAVTKVSTKIQQLLLTLKGGIPSYDEEEQTFQATYQRPKKKPLAEYFQDDECELLENAPVDENALKPEGTITAPREGGPLQPQTNIPHSIEAAIHRCGTANPKAPCLTSVDRNGKSLITLTYGKLLSRMRKVAFTLTGKKHGCQPGQRVALVFSNTEPVPFACTFYGCLLAGLVPVVVEVPMSSEDPGSSQLGFLLGSCSVSIALTSEHCMKCLPKTEKGELIQLKGWPKLQWITTDPRNLAKPPSTWEPSGHDPTNKLAFIEYKTGQGGSVMGVAHTRNSIYGHCRALVGALSYNAGDIMVNLLDFKKGFGLMHAILASVFSGMHVYCIPQAVMKQNPLHWLHVITKNKASIALATSRDLHWTLAMKRETGNVNLKTIRMLALADGANPWSIGSCDTFLVEFERRGLNRDAISPCAWSPEALTVAIRRSGSAAVRTALSLHGMSYNFIQEELPTSQTPSVVLQDCGNILPGSTVAVVKVLGDPNLCRTDEIGELLLSSNSSDAAEDGSCYYGLKGISDKTFHSHPIDECNHGQANTASFIRTGLLGYMDPSGRAFVTGRVDGMMQIMGRFHNSDDIVATVLAVEPVRFVHRGRLHDILLHAAHSFKSSDYVVTLHHTTYTRIAVFGIPVLRDDRLVVIVEQKADSEEKLCFKWMNSVMQAIEGIHNVGIYCLSLLSPNRLPRTPLGGVHLSETRARFLEGNLEPRNILMSPHQCILNLPKPRQKHKDIGAASILQGQVITGLRMAEAKGRPLSPPIDDDEGPDKTQKFQYLLEILKWRAQSNPQHVLFSQIGSKGSISNQMSCLQLHKRAEKVAQLLLSHSPYQGSTALSTGDHVALIFPPGVDLIVAFYGCLYAGCVPVPLRPPQLKSLDATLRTVRMVVEASKAVAVLSCASIIKTLRTKEAINALQQTSTPNWPRLLDVDDAPKKRIAITYRPPTPELLGYIDFSVTAGGILAGIKMSHYSSSQLCRAIKLQCELYPSRTVALCLDPYSGLGLALWCLSGVYSGHHSLLLSPVELETNPQAWLNVISQYKVRDVFHSYGVMELCTKGLASQIPTLKNRGVSLSQVKTCVVIAEERPRVLLASNFTKLFRDLGLSSRAVSTAFGCRVNVAVSLQGASSPDPTTVYVDMRALRNDRVTLVEKGSPHSLCLLETGKILPGTKVVIADPDTFGQCSDSKLGEIWVSSPHTAEGYFAVYGGGTSSNCQEHFQGHLTTGDTSTTYARTGFLGFLRRTDLTSATGERHDALYMVGSLEETLELRGMRYHPIDIENSVIRCSKKISECAIFHSNQLLVVVVEINGKESSALDLVPLVTNVILEDHYLIAGVVAVIDPGSIPVNSRGEKQRMHLRDAFLQDRLDPIYVAYNM